MLKSESRKNSQFHQALLNNSGNISPTRHTDIEAGYHSIPVALTPPPSRWTLRRKLTAAALALVTLGGSAVLAWRFWPHSTSHDEPIIPVTPLTSCNAYNITHFQNMVQSVQPVIISGYTLGSNCDLNTPLEEEYANANYGLFTQRFGNVTMAMFQVLGRTPEEMRERAFNFTQEAGFNANGVLTTLFSSKEKVCRYNNIYDFNEADSSFITASCENIFMVVCRTSQQSICSQLESLYHANAKRIAQTETETSTPYITVEGEVISALKTTEEENSEEATYSIALR